MVHLARYSNGNQHCMLQISAKPTSALTNKYVTAYYEDCLPVNSGSYCLVYILHHSWLSLDYGLVWSI